MGNSRLPPREAVKARGSNADYVRQAGLAPAAITARCCRAVEAAPAAHGESRDLHVATAEGVMAFGDWLSGVESRPGPFRLIQRWGPNLARHSAVLGEYHQCAAAFESLEQRNAACVAAGGHAVALRLIVIDGNWRRVDSA